MLLRNVIGMANEMEMFMKLVLTILSVGALIILNFVIYKIPIKGNDKQIVILSLVVGCTNFYSKFILDSDIYLYIQLLVYIIFLTILRRYPIFYSIIVCCVGSIVASMLDALLTIGALQMNLSTVEKMSNNFDHFIVFHVFSAMLYLALAIFLKHKNYGFNFVRRRFSGKYVIKRSNFIWAFLFIIGTIVLQLTNQRMDIFSLHGYILVGISILMTTSLVYSFVQNKASVRDRFGG